MLRRSIFILFIFLSHTAVAQNSDFVKDSISFENDLKKNNQFQEDYKKAELFFENSIVRLDSLIDKYPDSNYFLSRKAYVLDKLSVSEINKGNYAKAIQNLSDAITMRQHYGNIDGSAFSYYLRGIVWVRQEQYEKVSIEYDSALAKTERNIAKGEPRQRFKASIISAYAGHFANIKQFDKAESYFKKALRYTDSIEDKPTSATTRMQYAEVIGDNGRYKEALKLNLEAFNIYNDLDFTDGKMNARSAMALSYNALGNYQKAYEYKKPFMDHLRNTGRLDRLLVEYNEYISILENAKRYPEAFQAQKELTKLGDSLKNANKYKELADLDAKFKYESQKAIDSLNIISERKLVESERAKKANTRFWLVVLTLVLILISIAYFYLKNKQKIKEQAYQNIILNNKVATKTEEINELLTETIQHIKSKERIAENLQKLSNENEGITLKSIIADLKASKADNAKLMLIKQNIEQVNFEFIKKLKDLHPELTKTDVEICSLIRIGLSRKEVANLRNTSLEAVKTSRFRLKKKLNLSSEQSLDDYINTL